MAFDELIEHVVSSVILVLDADIGHRLAHLQHSLNVNLLRYDLISKEPQ